MDKLETKLKSYIEQEKLFLSTETILLAVSGGVDSVSMCELFHRIGQPFAIAHCNFKLREEDSDEDEKFVKSLAEHYQAPSHSETFETQSYATEKGISIQMAARELRYQWFAELLAQYEYAYIATAHHLDDSIETLFINLFRGTGVRGLRGILPKQNSIVHPLLFASRKDIEAFAEENNIFFREDKTNACLKYERNRIRHELLPLLQGYSKNFNEVMEHNLKLFRNTEVVLEEAVEKIKKRVLSVQNDKAYIDIEFLLQFDSAPFYLFEILRPYNFNESVVHDILQACTDIAGKQFYSSTHRIVKDRKYLIIVPIEDDGQATTEQPIFFVKKHYHYLNDPVKMQFELYPNSNGFVFDKRKTVAYFDYSKLKYPLTLRHWKNGDFFLPYGMAGKKMLSNLFSDLKFSLIDKENFWLLCSGDDIIWAVGERTDRRYKVTKKTRKILKITIALDHRLTKV